MSITWRKVLVYTLSFTLAIATVPAHTAQAASSQDKWEEVKEDFDLLTPVRRGERFAELYNRIETRLADYQKEEIAVLNKKLKYTLSSMKTPEVKATADSLTIKEGDQTLVIKVHEDKDGVFTISANGRVFTEDEAVSPLIVAQILQKLSNSPEAKKSSWIFDLLVPKAQAFSWSTILIGAVGVGVVGYLFYKKKKKSKAAACKSEPAVCCDVASKPLQLTNGCCSDAGGLKTASPTCPTTFYMIDGTSTGTSTDTSTSSGTR